jgi:hypothetical protein
MADETKEITSIDEAFAQASQEAEGQEEESSPKASEETPKESASSENTEEPQEESSKEEATAEEGESLPPPDMTGVEAWPDDLKEEYERRIKGFQAAFTKRQQALAEKEKEMLSGLEEKYNQAINRLRGGTPEERPKEKTSLKDYFPEADPTQLEALEQAFSGMVEAKLKPLVEENKVLREAYTQDVNQRQAQVEWNALKGKYRLEDGFLNEMVAFAQTNPQVVQGQSLENIYKLMTYETQAKLGRQQALAELKKKEKESLESGSSANTVEQKEVGSVRDAWTLAEKEFASRNKE